jgi:hypothetical protein
MAECRDETASYAKSILKTVWYCYYLPKTRENSVRNDEAAIRTKFSVDRYLAGRRSGQAASESARDDRPWRLEFVHVRERLFRMTSVR